VKSKRPAVLTPERCSTPSAAYLLLVDFAFPALDIRFLLLDLTPPNSDLMESMI
jgi:hypothetical protein